jgi:hypothetical protein
MKSLESISLIAPCGMNCGICMAYLRKKNKCNGCRATNVWKPVTREQCKIKNCSNLSSQFCSACEEFPCKRLKHLDKRYRTKYGMSMIENLQTIEEAGIKKFLEMECSRWACPFCGGTICVHTRHCSNCTVAY